MGHLCREQGPRLSRTDTPATARRLTLENAMPVPSSSLLLLCSFAASLPARLGAAWSAFLTFDEGADQAQGEREAVPVPDCHSGGTTEQEAAPAVAQEAPVEAAPPGRTGEDWSAVEAGAIASHLEDGIAWMAEIDTPEWRRSPWRAKVQSMMQAAARGAMLTSLLTDRNPLRDSVTIKSAVNLLAHELNHPLSGYYDVGVEAPTEYQN